MKKNISYRKRNRRRRLKYRGAGGAVAIPSSGIELPTNKLPINKLPINKLPINKLPINELPINELPINKLPPGLPNPIKKPNASQFYPKSVIVKILEYLLHTMYSVAGVFIYYPIFLLNIPNTNLESLIPTKEGCKTLIGDELMCKRKIKCFFKKCDIVEDPTGYVIGKQRELATRKNKVHGESKKKQKLLQGGGMRFTRNKRKYKYMKYIPKKVKKAMKKSMKKDLRKLMRLYRSIMRQKGGGNAERSNTETSVNPGNNNEENSVSRGNNNEKSGNNNENPENNNEENSVSATKKNNQNTSTNNEVPPPTDESYENTGNNHQENSVSATKNNNGVPPPTDESESLDQSTCINKTVRPDGTVTSNYTLCNTQPYIDYKGNELENNVFYKLLFGRNEIERQKETAEKMNQRMNDILSVGNISATEGANNGSTDPMNTSAAIIEDFFMSQMDGESLYKMLVTYKMLDNIFQSTVSTDKMNKYSENISIKPKGVDVSFPWHTKNSGLSLDDRRECLLNHLTKSNLGDDFKSNELYEKCFVCKNCTLANTGYKALENIFSNLFVSSAKEFQYISHDLYHIMNKHFDYELLPIKQYYLITLISMNMIHPALDLSKLRSKISVGNKLYDARDLILGIPKFNIKVDLSPEIIEKLQETYMAMKMMNMEDILYRSSYATLFKRIAYEKNPIKRIHEIKKQMHKLKRMFYGNQKIHTFEGENQITSEELSHFNVSVLSKLLNEANIDESRHSPQDVADEFNQMFQDFTPLYLILFDDENYDKVSVYEENDDLYIQYFANIIDKIASK